VDEARPRVGVGVLIVRNGRVLLGERRGSHGSGTWAPPGGHLEYGETVEACAEREALEECGLRVRSVTRGPYTTDIFEAERKHYVTLFVTAVCDSGEPSVREPHKCAQWRWCAWSDLPTPLFAPLASLHAGGFVPDGAVI
jgi:8-oxo-dGTP diphosphatase